MLVLILCIVSLFVLFVADLCSFLLNRKGWHRFVTTFLFFISQIIATQFILGLIHTLNGTALVAFNVLVSSAALGWLIRSFGSKKIRAYLPALRQSLRRLGTLAKEDRLWLVLAIMTLLSITWIIFIGIIFPVTDFDGNSYHLTFVANVIQNEHIYDAPTSLPWLIGYPKGGEFIQMWSTMISRSDFVADLAQVPFLLLGMYALYEIACLLGVSKRNARFVVLLYLFMPIVANQLKTTYVDLILSSLYFAGIAVLIRKKMDRLDFVLLGMIFSLLISVKSTGFLFVLVMLPLLFWKLYASIPVKKNIAKKLIAPLLLIAAPTVFGFYWYIKNWVVYGTPIYPFGFKLLGRSVFPGRTFQEFAADAVTSTSLPDGCIQRIWFVWTEQKDWFGCLYNYDTNYAGFGPIWFIVLLPALLTGLYFAIRKRHYLFLGITAMTGVLFMLYPANYYTRYTIFVTGIGILALGYALTIMKAWATVPVKIISILLAVFVIATNFTLCNFPPETIKAQLKGLFTDSIRGPKYSNSPGIPFVFLERQVHGGDVVAYSSKPYFIYPLWEADYSNEVVYIPADTEEFWLREIKGRGVKFVLTTLISQENEWAAGDMQSIYKDEMYEIFKVY